MWRNPDFVKLWAGQTISHFGSLVSGTALPFTAILVLGAAPLQLAFLSAADLIAGLLVGLVAGVWVDRLRRRPILIGADMGRAVLLASVPAAAFVGLLRMEHLYVVAFLTGVLTICFDVAYLSYLPALVRREDLVEANSTLSASAAVAEVGALGSAGWLVQWFTAPIAVLLDALSFVCSALLVGWIRAPEPAPAGQRQNLRREIAEGLGVLWRNPLLRALAGSIVTLECSSRMVGTVILLFASRELGFGPGFLGMVFAVGGISSLMGALLAGRAADRFGIGPVMVAGLVGTGLGVLFVPLAHGATVLAALLLVANQLVTDPAWTIYEINQVSLRQAIIPHGLLGRVNASIRFLGLGAMLLGALLGGVLGETVGLRATLVVGAAGMCLAAAWLALSPVRTLKVPPGAVERAPARLASVGTATE
ncbi:MAG: MFS transporter [Chloroflexi bacterium]|nr:MFS transporter [Chloroflexota bacterium]